EDTLMVNEILVRTGLASVYIFPYDQKNMEYRGKLIIAQIQARTENRGIWSLPPPEPVEESYFGNPNSFRFHRPGCRSLRRTDKSRLLEYSTRDELVDAGFSACRICKP
ncbi:MAG: thermonuclease family protein, partial [candidate division Zixibacteria bacterium]|nr:thermonuclease family protein [candidate division Zixibacteria bacterium]